MKAVQEVKMIKDKSDKRRLGTVLVFFVITCMALYACGSGGGGSSTTSPEENPKPLPVVTQQVAQDVLYAAYGGSGSAIDIQDGALVISPLEGITTGYIKLMLYEILNPSGLMNIFYDADCECKTASECIFKDCIKTANIYAFKDLITEGSATFEYDLKNNKKSVGKVRFSLQPTKEWSLDPNVPNETSFKLNIGFNSSPGYVSTDLTSKNFKFTGTGTDDLVVNLKGYTSCYFAKTETINGQQVITPVSLEKVGNIFDAIKVMVMDALNGTNNFPYTIVFSFYIGSGDINAKNLNVSFGDNFKNSAKYNDWSIIYSNKGNETKKNNYYELPQFSIFDTPKYFNKFYKLNGSFTLNDAKYPYSYDMIYGQLDSNYYENLEEYDKTYIGFQGDISVPSSQGEKISVYSTNSKVFSDVFNGMSIDNVNFLGMQSPIDSLWRTGMLSMNNTSGKVTNVYLNSDGSAKFNTDSVIKNWKSTLMPVK